jgi:uncharacterized protein YcaQ
VTELSPDDARRYLVHAHGLSRPLGAGADDVCAWHRRVGCVQLDPLDRVGTNAELASWARVDGLGRNAVYDALLPGHAFEHFAKERCLLPAAWFADWRARTVVTAWWRLGERHRALDAGLVADVLAEVRERGPLRSRDLEDRGRVAPMDWNGWKGTSRAATMALEILWTRGQVVVCRRTGSERWHDVPERALPGAWDAAPSPDFLQASVVRAVRAAGLLGWPGGQAVWAVLRGQKDAVRDAVARGAVEQVRIAGSARTWLAPAGFRDEAWDEPDDRLRILPPLDSLLWDRNLLRLAFGFDYVWEIYKPATQRRHGWYTLPLLHRGRLVGRMEASRDGAGIRVDGLWPEDGETVDAGALRLALDRLAVCNFS